MNDMATGALDRMLIAFEEKCLSINIEQTKHRQNENELKEMGEMLQLSIEKSSEDTKIAMLQTHIAMIQRDM